MRTPCAAHLRRSLVGRCRRHCCSHGPARTLSDSTSLWISVPLPEGFEPGQGTITRVSQGQASAVVLADDKLFHDLAAN